MPNNALHSDVPGPAGQGPLVRFAHSAPVSAGVGPQKNMRPLSAVEARAFADRWLPAWTGNNPELLASFYSEDAFYSDPAVRHKGKAAFLAYFKKLLAYNPKWVWTQLEGIPMEDGLLALRAPPARERRR